MSQVPHLAILWNSDRPLPLLQYLGLGKKEGAAKSAHFEHLGRLPFSELFELHGKPHLTTSICFLKRDGEDGHTAAFWRKTVPQGELSLPETLTPNRPAQWLYKESGQVWSCGFSTAWPGVFSLVRMNLNTTDSLGHEYRLRWWQIFPGFRVELKCLFFVKPFNLHFLHLKWLHSIWKFSSSYP